MFNVLAIALLQAASIICSASATTPTTSTPVNTIDGGSSGWGGDIAAIDGGSSGWGGDIA